MSTHLPSPSYPLVYWGQEETIQGTPHVMGGHCPKDSTGPHTCPQSSCHLGHWGWEGTVPQISHVHTHIGSLSSSPQGTGGGCHRNSPRPHTYPQSLCPSCHPVRWTWEGTVPGTPHVYAHTYPQFLCLSCPLVHWGRECVVCCV